jgi:hypothetical protein
MTMLGVLTTVAALAAAGPTGPLPDPTCPGCIAVIELVPVTTPPWTTASAYDERYYHALPKTPKDYCTGFTPEICKHWIDPVADGAGYSDKYIGITTDPALLSDIFHPDGKAPKFEDAVRIVLVIELFERRAEYDPSQIRVTKCGATGRESPSVHVDWRTRIIPHTRPEPCDLGLTCAVGSDFPHRDKIINATMTIQTDPATLATCTIDFSRGSDVSEGRPIPPVTLRRYTRYFPELTP